MKEIIILNGLLL